MRPKTRAGAGVSPAGFPPLEGARRFSHSAMATVFEVHCVHDDPVYARQAAQAAFEVADHLEQALSRFLANSDVSRINDLRVGERTVVCPETLECLAIARHMFDLTGGAFDVSIGTGLDALELGPDELSVRVHRSGLRLDLGGIGKGYAVDLMAERLQEWGLERALVHGGFSSVRALLPPPDRHGWPLTLSAPWSAEPLVLARLEARQMALSASGTRKGGHILDPRTGRPAQGRAAWAAIHEAPDGEGARPEAATGDMGPASASDARAAPRPAAVAEGLSTAFMLLPVEVIEDACRRWPQVEAWLAPEPAKGEGEGNAARGSVRHFAGVR